MQVYSNRDVPPSSWAAEGALKKRAKEKGVELQPITVHPALRDVKISLNEDY